MVTLTGNENIVHDQLKMQFEARIGLRPSLAIEPWEIKVNLNYSKWSLDAKS